MSNDLGTQNSSREANIKVSQVCVTDVLALHVYSLFSKFHLYTWYSDNV
jgi:hypothetical protein